MRRITAVALLAAATVATALVAGVVAAGADSGPKCADITNGQFNYATSGTLNGQLILLDASCKSVVYTLFVIVDAGEPIAVPQSGTNAGNPTFSTTISDDDPNICVFATAASKGGHVHDRAPDVGCLTLTAGTTGGGSGFE